MEDQNKLLGSGEEENNATTSYYSSEHNIKIDSPVQGQVIGDHANVTIVHMHTDA